MSHEPPLGSGSSGAAGSSGAGGGASFASLGWSPAEAPHAPLVEAQQLKLALSSSVTRLPSLCDDHDVCDSLIVEPRCGVLFGAMVRLRRAPRSWLAPHMIDEYCAL